MPINVRIQIDGASLELSGDITFGEDAMDFLADFYHAVTGDTSPAADARLTSIEQKLDAIHQQGDQLMAGQAESNALLDQLNDYTNRLADSQAEQTTAIQNISDDIDRLIAETTDTTVRDRLEQLKAKTAAIADASDAQTQTLKNIAAKKEEPLPPPVEP